MATLTWRNVDAPDFRTSLEGIKTFSSLLGNAFGGLERGLDTFDNAQSGRANRDFSMQLAQLGDADAARAALPELFARYGNRLDANSIAAAQERPTQLLREATTRTALDSAKAEMGRADYRFGNERRDADAEFATRPDLANFIETGKISDALRNSKGFVEAYKNRDNLLTSSLNREDTRQTMGIRAEDQNFQREDRIAETLGIQGARNILSVSRTGEDAINALDKLNLPPRAYAAALGQIEQRFGNIYGGAAASTGSGGAGGSFSYGAPQQAVSATLKQGGLSDAVVSGLLGNFHIEGGYTGAQGDGGTAGGIAQWRKERRDNFTKIIGTDPTQASPEQQAKFVLWELNNPESAGMTKVQALSIKNAKTPEEAAALIDKYYERSDGRSTNARMAAARQASSLLTPGQKNEAATIVKQSIENRVGIGNTVLSTLNDDTKLPDIITKAVASPEFKGVKPALLQEKLRWVMQEGNVNAATAYEVIKNARVVPETNNSIFGGLFNIKRANTNLGNGWELNDDAIRAEIKNLKPRRDTRNNPVASRAITAALGKVNDSNRQVTIESAQAQLVQARAALQAQIQAAQTRPGIASPGQLERYRQAVALAEAQLKAVQR